jgi:hypothetical protein
MVEKAKIGDWVRIMRGGVLVIAEVRYIDRSGYGSKYVLDTGGTTDDDNVYEVRRKKEPTND